MKKIILCTWCIEGIKSHGEKVYVGDSVQDCECEVCHEKADEEELYKCIWE